MSRPKQKNTLEHHRHLDVRRLYKAGALQPGYSGSWAWWRDGDRTASIGMTMPNASTLRLYYHLSRDDKPEMLDYPVPITWTPCQLGGHRPWFLCPCCGRRVAVLYLRRYFACRHCLRLNYASQQASKRDLALDLSWKLRHALGCELGLMDLPAECIPRPKGMHLRTFARKLARLQQVDARAQESWQQQIAGLERRLRRIDKQLSSR
ncbi:hypothetical protein [Pseudomonas benzenivorans]|uniref:Transposase zinc-ribbon domain-containing protein n=1 Tax=Pseudomonas benzenivorans TaxID=556533 RepID=A0ABY5H6D4_9PSED|nr:hypothetical protein [Pseudomonas benzenivorans]UTW07872.1 hypothetical protein KDW96_00595 [Pseudomonas benzenivorans]